MESESSRNGMLDHNKLKKQLDEIQQISTKLNQRNKMNFKDVVKDATKKGKVN